MANKTQYPGMDPVSPEWDHLRQGTREQYSSGWTLIPGGHAQEFLHNLGEVPWMVSILQSETADGNFAIEAGSNATIVYMDEDSVVGTGDTTITVTSALSAGVDRYFLVRAM